MTDIFYYHNNLPSPHIKIPNALSDCPDLSHVWGIQGRARSRAALKAWGPVKILMQPNNCLLQVLGWPLAGLTSVNPRSLL